MTGSSSNRSRMFQGFDSYKNREWVRRRKLRIEQVRKQSNEIARSLRQKVTEEEKARADEMNKIEEAKFRYWKAEKLNEMERKLRCALEEFGMGYRLAEAEPDADEIVREKNKINSSKAQERGEMAKQEELRKKKIAEEKKMSPIQRKKMARKFEDLRSALIRSVPIRKHLSNFSEEHKDECESDTDNVERKKITLIHSKVSKQQKDEEPVDVIHKKMFVKKLSSRKPSVNQSSKDSCRTCNCKSKGQTGPSQRQETCWINLNEIQSSSTTNSGIRSRSSETSVNCAKPQKEKSDRTVEFFNYPSRHSCKPLKSFDNLVERIDPETEPDATELAKEEEEFKKLETQRKHEADLIRQERGNEALRREKINRDYNNLIAKLEELHKKEKIIKAQQRILPSVIHMNDERLSERTKTKQRIMDSKFERIFYEATGEIPRTGPQPEFHPECIRPASAGGDYFDPYQKMWTKLSFSPDNLKTNSPVTPDDVPRESHPKTSDSPKIHRPKKMTKNKKKKKLMSDIEKALRKGRKLRKGSRNWEIVESKSLEESSDVESGKNESGSDSSTVKQIKPPQNSPCAKEEDEQTRESRTHEPKESESCKNNEVRGRKEIELKPLGMGAKMEDDSLSHSTSTCYKSPPSVLKSCTLNKFLEYLDEVSDKEENLAFPNDPKLRRKIEKMLNDLLHKKASPKSKEEVMDFQEKPNPALEYYILRLLNMSRECVANLSVSSESMSTPHFTDLELRNEIETCSRSELQSEYSSRSLSKGEDLIRDYRLKRAEELDSVIQNWKTILSMEKNIDEIKQPETAEEHDEPDYPLPTRTSTFQQDELITRRMETPEPEKSERGPEVEEESDVGVLCNQKTVSKYDSLTKKCSERISQLSSMLNKVRKDKEKLLSSTSGTSSLNFSKDEGNSEKGVSKWKEDGLKCSSIVGQSGSGVNLKSPGALKRYSLSGSREENLSTLVGVDSQSLRGSDESRSSLESFPDVMDELLKREILTSPFKWSGDEFSAELSDINEPLRRPSSIQTVIHNFRKEMSKIKPFSLVPPGGEPRRSISMEEKYREVRDSAKKAIELEGTYSDFCHGDFLPDEKEQVSHSKFCHQEESSVESINHALTNLGLNWAKSFLRKNEESKAMSSSSSSEERKSSEDEENYYYRKTND